MASTYVWASAKPIPEAVPEPEVQRQPEAEPVPEAEPEPKPKPRPQSQRPTRTRSGRGLYGDWHVKYSFNEREITSILSFTRNSEGNQAGQWISFWGVSELKDVKFEDGKLSFAQVRQNRDGETRTSKFEGTIEDGKLAGTMSSERGEYTLEGERRRGMPGAVGSWGMKLETSEEDVSPTLIIKADKENNLTGEWKSQNGKHEITDVNYRRGKLSFKRKSTLNDRQWESTFDGTLKGSTVSGTIKSEKEPIAAEGKRLGGTLIGNWDLDITSERGERKQRLKVHPDMSGLYGAIALDKVDLEGDEVSFSVAMQFGERKFEMSFKGKLDGSNLTGEMTTSRGTQKVKGAKIVRRSRRGGQGNQNR